MCVFLRPPRRGLSPAPEPAGPPPSSSSASLCVCATPAPTKGTQHTHTKQLKNGLQHWKAPWESAYFWAVVCFRFQFIHGNQSFQEAAFQKAHRSRAIETSVRIGQDEFERNGEASHVHGEGPTGTPAGVEAHHLGGFLCTGYVWIPDNNTDWR